MTTLGFPRFTKQFASTGIVTALTDAQANAGWAFLGSAPPTVEEFNAMMQSFDDKDNWLFNNIQTLVTSAGSAAPADGVFTALQTALNALYAGKNLLTDTGGANAYVVAFTPVVAAPVPGVPFWMLVKTTNTGASTLNGSTAGALPLVGGAHSPLQGNELIANAWALIDFNAGLNSYVLLECTGASVQVGKGVQPLHAAQISQTQNAGWICGLRAKNNVGTPATQFDIAALSVTLREPATGIAYTVFNPASVTVNALTAGPAVNGRDQAAALTNGTWVRLYYIYNPTTQTLAGIVSAAVPTVGPALPAGYTAWQYVGAIFWGSTTFALGNFRGSWFNYQASQSAVAGGTSTTLAGIAIPNIVPPPAESGMFELSVPNLSVVPATGSFSVTLSLSVEASGTTSQIGLQGTTPTTTNNQGVATQGKRFANLSQGFNYQLSVVSGTGYQASISVNGYSVNNGGE